MFLLLFQSYFCRLYQSLVGAVDKLLDIHIFVSCGELFGFLKIQYGSGIGVPYRVLYQNFTFYFGDIRFVPEYPPARVFYLFLGYIIGVIEYSESSPHIRYKIIVHINFAVGSRYSGKNRAYLVGNILIEVGFHEKRVVLFHHRKIKFFQHSATQ